MDPDHQTKIVVQPGIRSFPFVAGQLWKECVVFPIDHPSIVLVRIRHVATTEDAGGTYGLLSADSRRCYGWKMHNEQNKKDREKRPIPVVSRRLRSGEIIEMLFEAETGKTAFARGGLADPDIVERVEEDGRTYVPYSATNNLLTHRVLLLPSEIGRHEPAADLIDSVRAFIHRYVDLSDAFEEVAAHYVLLTWVHDQWNELPYLRVRGEFGTGKSRFLLTVGSVCWKPLFASGASTVSPIFRLLDEVGGTLVIDEADFWQSDEKAEIVKILNNGNARGFPVLRTEVNAAKEFSPRAFNIFGPKIVATRHPFEDDALESRCLSEVFNGRQPRQGIPVSLPESFEREAQDLRNRLLRYRLDHVHMVAASARIPKPGMSARRAQIIAAMLEIAVDDETRERLCTFATSGTTQDGNSDYRLRLAILKVLKNMKTAGDGLAVGAIGRRVSESLGVSLSDRQVGACIRQLGLSTHKSNGVYRITPADLTRVDELFQQYGLGDIGDVGDVVRGDGVAGQQETTPSVGMPG